MRLARHPYTPQKRRTKNHGNLREPLPMPNPPGNKAEIRPIVKGQWWWINPLKVAGYFLEEMWHWGVFPLDSPWKNPSAPQTVVLQILLRFVRLAQGTWCHATPELRLEVSCGGCNATSTCGLIFRCHWAFRYHSRCMGCNLIWGWKSLFHKTYIDSKSNKSCENNLH